MDDLAQALAAVGEGFLIIIIVALVVAIVLLLEDLHGEDNSRRP
jgi:hypothetical protein